MSGLNKWGDHLGWKNIGIATLIYILTVIISYMLLIKPQFVEYDSILKKQENIGNTYVRLTQVNVEESIDSVNVQLGKLKQYQVAYESRIADQNDLKAIIPFIDDLGKKSSLEVNSLAIMDKTDKAGPGLKKHYVNMVVRSKYFFPVADFMNALDEYPKWVNIESFELKPLGELNQLTMVISMVVRS